MTGTGKALMLFALVLPLLGGVASADVLLIEEVRQASKSQLPENGLSKSVVEATFGAPVKRHEPVGDPPITRWDYETYSVYFEYDLVLYSVLAPGAVLDGA